MREYKFRGKRIDTGEWVYGHLFETPLTVENFEAGFLGTGKKRVCISDKCGVVFEIDPKTVGQFTGLHDKNGCEVYEGDIVRKGHYRYGLNPTNQLIGVVSYKVSPDGCRFVLKPHRYGPSRKDGCTGCPMDIEPDLGFYNSRTEPEKQADLIEVIGTIHENPELLEGK